MENASAKASCRDPYVWRTRPPGKLSRPPGIENASARQVVATSMYRKRVRQDLFSRCQVNTPNHHHHIREARKQFVSQICEMITGGWRCSEIVFPAGRRKEPCLSGCVTTVGGTRRSARVSGVPPEETRANRVSRVAETCHLERRVPPGLRVIAGMITAPHTLPSAPCGRANSPRISPPDPCRGSRADSRRCVLQQLWKSWKNR